MAKLMLICGKIASGKSYYARTLCAREHAVILSTDELTWALFDNEQGEGYDRLAARANAYLMKKAIELVRNGCSIVLDWGFWRREDRKRITADLTAQGIRPEWHYVRIPDALWEKHIAERNARIQAGQGGSDFYVDEGLKAKLISLWEEPDAEEMDHIYQPVE